jgi:thioredoxin reductase (NADPH)
VEFAGLTAGLVAARLGRKTVVLVGDLLGGLLLSIAKIEGGPGFPDGVPGCDLCPMAQEQAVAAGAHMVAQWPRAARRQLAPGHR